MGLNEMCQDATEVQPGGREPATALRSLCASQIRATYSPPCGAGSQACVAQTTSSEGDGLATRRVH